PLSLHDALPILDGIDPVEELGDTRLDVGVGDADELALVSRDVDVAAVGNARDDELRHSPEQLLVVERLAQALRRLEQQSEPRARRLGLAPRFPLPPRGERLLRD